MPDTDSCECGNKKQEQYDTCYTCSMKAKGFQECSKCNNKWHDPKFECCYDCSGKSKAETPS